MPNLSKGFAVNLLIIKDISDSRFVDISLLNAYLYIMYSITLYPFWKILSFQNIMPIFVRKYLALSYY